MKSLEAIHKIQASKMEYGKKDMLCWLVSNFDCFLVLKNKYPEKGLRKACLRELGISFLGMYGINTLEDVVKKAQQDNLLA